MRRKRMDVALLTTTLGDLSELPILPDSETPARGWTTVADVASRFALTAYDAAYLELAPGKRIPLATLDSRLADSARAAGVDLI